MAQPISPPPTSISSSYFFLALFLALTIVVFSNGRSFFISLLHSLSALALRLKIWNRGRHIACSAKTATTTLLRFHGGSLICRQFWFVLPIALLLYIFLTVVINLQSNMCSSRFSAPFSSWTHHVNFIAAACFILSTIHHGTVAIYLSCMNLSVIGSSMDHPRSVYFAAATVSLIAGVSSALSIASGYGPICMDALGVESYRSQWSEWMVAVPLLGYITIAIEDKPCLTRQDQAVIFLMFLAIFFGFLMNLYEDSRNYTIGYTLFIASVVCMSGNVFMAVWSDQGHKELLKSVDSQAPKLDISWQVDRLSRKNRLAWLLASTFPSFGLIYLLGFLKLIDRDLLVVGNIALGLLLKIVFVGFLSFEALSVQISLEARANQSRRQFLRYVFHEVRVPLNTITMGLSVLENDCISSLQACPVALEVLAMMRGSAGFMSDTLNDVLSMSKIEDGSMTLTMQPFKVENLVKAALVVVKGQARAKDINLLTDIKSVEEKWWSQKSILGDRFRLEHAIVNFLSNAIKFSPEGSSVTVKVLLRQTSSSSSPLILSDKDRSRNRPTVTQPLAYLSTPPRVELTVLVMDQGVGISPENQKKLFVPFAQIRSHELQQGRGTGLGLVLAKEIVEMHGGHVILESEEGHGSTFGFNVELEEDICEDTSEAMDTDSIDKYMSSERITNPIEGNNVIDIHMRSSAMIEARDTETETRSRSPTCPLSSNKRNCRADTGVMDAAGIESSLSWPSPLRSSAESLQALSVDPSSRSPLAMSPAVAQVATAAAVSRTLRSSTRHTQSSLTSADAPTGYITGHNEAKQSSRSSSNRLSSHHQISAVHLNNPEYSQSLTCGHLSSTGEASLTSSNVGSSPSDSQHYANSRLSVSANSDVAPSRKTTGGRRRKRELVFSSSSSSTCALNGETKAGTSTSGRTTDTYELVRPRSSEEPETKKACVSRDDGSLTTDNSATEESPSKMILADASDEESERVIKADLSAMVVDRRQPRYLLVDDTISNCKILKMLLARHQIDCELAYDGAQAVDAVKQRGESFDVIFMDHTMPVKNGLEATAEIRALRFSGLIIGLTGNALDDDVEKFLKAGADGVFAKPFTDGQLRMILQLIAQHGSTSSEEMRRQLLLAAGYGRHQQPIYHQCN